ncbi:hypothetical protein EVA_07216 [gut metagenome]|uniref:Uncharacterized protein n=1 Tax=gut metagenome TaxID=749906 RepID=J9CWP8_9ZZZZ
MLVIDFSERKNAFIIAHQSAVKSVETIVVIKFIASAVHGKAATADTVCHSAHKRAKIAGLCLIRRHIRAADQNVYRTVFAVDDNALQGSTPGEHRNGTI